MRTILLFFISMISFVVYYLLFTSSGLQTEIRLLQKIIPGELTIQYATGALFSNFELKQIDYSLKKYQMHIHLNRLKIHWSPAALLNTQLQINLLQINQANIVISKLPTSQNNKKISWQLPNWVKHIMIQNANIHSLKVKLLNNQFNLSGNIAEQWNIAWQATIKNIKTFQPELNGQLTFNGTIQGPRLTPLINNTIQLKNFSYDQNKIGLLRLIANIALKPNMPSHINIQAKNLIIQDRRIQSSQIKIDGMFTQKNNLSQLNLKIDHFHVPFIDIHLKNILMTAILDNRKNIFLESEMHSGRGFLKLNGTFNTKQIQQPINLALQGEQFEIIHSTEYQIAVSPKLNIHFNQQQFFIDGNLFIPTARIQLKNPDNLITLSHDVVFTNQVKKNHFPFSQALQINLQLGENIHIAYENLETNLTGHLQLQQVTNGSLTAIGELTAIHGTYQAYGQSLSIETGRLLYTGGLLSDPGLNIVAVKKIRGVNVANDSSQFSHSSQLQSVYTGSQIITLSIRVTGVLSQPIISFFSNPAMDQKDIISYLVFGYPSSQISAHQMSALFSTLSALWPNNGTNVTNTTNKLEKRLGFDELNIASTEIFDPNTSTTVSTTSLILGKKLLPKLSLRYSIGLFYPISILNLRYQLGKYWALQSETSTIDNGADVLFSIDKN